MRRNVKCGKTEGNKMWKYYAGSVNTKNDGIECEQKKKKEAM